MPTGAKKLATYDDVLSAPRHQVAELLAFGTQTMIIRQLPAHLARE